MVVDRLLKENQHLISKYDKTISAVDKALKESASYGAGLDSFKKNSLAVMLDNVSNDFDLRCGRLSEAQGTQVGDIARKNEYLNLIAAVMPTLVAEDIVSVQPLKQKAGVAYYMKHVYDSNRGQISKGDRISDYIQVGPDTDKLSAAVDYSSEAINGEVIVLNENKAVLAWSPVVPGSFSAATATDTVIDDGQGKLKLKTATTEVGTIDYTTGSIAFTVAQTITDNEVNYAQDLYTAPVDVPAVKSIIADVTITARPRKLKTGFSMDAAFDLQATQNIDLQSLLQATATDEIRSEIDGEILRDLGNSGTGMTVAFNQPAPFGVNKRDHYESFYYTLIEGANKVYNKTRKVTPNVVICGENASNIVEFMDKFKAAPSLNTAGPHIMGTLGNRFLVVKNPYYPADKFTLVYKGDDILDTGFVYCPYMAITATQFLLDETFYGRQGFATSYGKKLVAPEFFCEGLITHTEN